MLSFLFLHIYLWLLSSYRNFCGIHGVMGQRIHLNQLCVWCVTNAGQIVSWKTTRRMVLFQCWTTSIDNLRTWFFFFLPIKISWVPYRIWRTGFSVSIQLSKCLSLGKERRKALIISSSFLSGCLLLKDKDLIYTFFFMASRFFLNMDDSKKLQKSLFVDAYCLEK